MHWHTVQWVKHDVGWSLWVEWIKSSRKGSRRVGFLKKYNEKSEKV